MNSNDRFGINGTTETPTSSTLSLYELNNVVRALMEAELDDEYWIEAEFSECRVATNGHCYVEFIQKSSDGRTLVAKARGTIWSRQYHLLAPLFERATGERLRAGMKVRVLVSVTFHEVYGYSLNVLDIDPAYTLGDLAKRRREILKQLEADGIAHDNQELPLPTLLKRVAIISSATAAGYGDFCDQLLHNEYGLHFDLRLFPAMMQGTNVEASVLAALEAVMEEADAFDVAVIIRGGGATSDLSDFESYSLAAAVAQMPLPVIVGIGHERDETVLDLVAHTRVKTPTAAAAFLIEHGAAQLSAIEDLSMRIHTAVTARLRTQDERLKRLSSALPRAFALMSERQGRLTDSIQARITGAARRHLLNCGHALEQIAMRFEQQARMQSQQAHARLQLMESRMTALDPALQLRRGYSLTYTSEGKLIRDVASVRPGQLISTRLADGTIVSQVMPHAVTQE